MKARTILAWIGVATSACGSAMPPPPADVPEAFAKLPAADVLVLDETRLFVAPGDVGTAERVRARNAFRVAEAVLKSPCFRTALASAEMTHTRGRTNAQVSGDLLEKTVFGLTLFDGTRYQNRVLHTVGFDDPRDPTMVHSNRYFVGTSVYLLASNILHEAAHAHDYIHVSAKESSSVPYTMNTLFDRCAGTVVQGWGGTMERTGAVVTEE